MVGCAPGDAETAEQLPVEADRHATLDIREQITVPAGSATASSPRMYPVARRVEAAICALRRLVSTLCGVIPFARA
ncbi:hypothetical protein GCM10009559_28690 [Pseudonocardia zijingensis]|uniref:Uncharacterized protein n=1 Tax=Pseudonocardia zijingensis TaxID=153376 RepID=A0ABP4AGE5_9PSEU